MVTHSSSMFQALDSLQRAQELADGMGNKVFDLCSFSSQPTRKTGSGLLLRRDLWITLTVFFLCVCVSSCAR